MQCYKVEKGTAILRFRDVSFAYLWTGDQVCSGVRRLRAVQHLWI